MNCQDPKPKKVPRRDRQIAAGLIEQITAHAFNPHGVIAAMVYALTGDSGCADAICPDPRARQVGFWLIARLREQAKRRTA